MTCAICQKLENHYRGLNCSSIFEFENSIMVLGEHQFHRYYCMVLAKKCVREIHHLTPNLRHKLMEEVFTAGAFLEDLTGCSKINYSCLGNAVPHIHWHIFPRYSDDPDFKLSPWLHFNRFKDFELDRDKTRQRATELFKGLRKFLAKKGGNFEA